MQLFIYGGRNEEIFQKTENVALNDICIFNLNKKEWVAVAMYGRMPCSRWSHVVLPNRSHNADQVFVFGGMNLNNYCKAELYTFQILNQSEPTVPLPFQNAVLKETQ